MSVESVGFTLFERAVGKGQSAEADGGGAYALRPVIVAHCIEVEVAHLGADVPAAPGLALLAGARSKIVGTRFRLIRQAAHPRLAAHRTLPLVAHFTLKARGVVMRECGRMRIGAHKDRYEIETLEHAGADIETLVARRGVGDLRYPVRVDVTHANAAQGRYPAQKRGAAAHAKQCHVVQDGIGAKDADIPPHFDLSPCLVAKEQVILPDVDRRATERGAAASYTRIRAQRGIEPDRDADVEVQLP